MIKLAAMARNGIRSKPAVRRRPFVDATLSWRWIRRMEIGCQSQSPAAMAACLLVAVARQCQRARSSSSLNTNFRRSQKCMRSRSRSATASPSSVPVVHWNRRIASAARRKRRPFMRSGSGGKWRRLMTPSLAPPWASRMAAHAALMVWSSPLTAPARSPCAREFAHRLCGLCLGHKRREKIGCGQALVEIPRSRQTASTLPSQGDFDFIDRHAVGVFFEHKALRVGLRETCGPKQVPLWASLS